MGMYVPLGGMYVCMFWFEYGRHEEARFFLSFFSLSSPCLALSLFRVSEKGVIRIGR